MSDHKPDEKVKELYRRELENLRVRSYRASKMEYEQASKYDGIMEVVESITYSTIPFGFFIGKRLKSIYKGGAVALPGLILFSAEVFNFYTTPLKEYVPIIYRRAMMHNVAAAKWEGLQYMVESNLIMMNKKSISAEQTKAIYEDLVKQRQAISADVIVRSKVYDHYNDPKIFEKKIQGKTDVNAAISKILPCLHLDKPEIFESQEVPTK